MAEAGDEDDPSLLEVQATAHAQRTDPANGLDPQEAARRLAADGPNELRSAPPVPAWRRILAQFRDPLIYLLLAAVAISLLAWVIGWDIAVSDRGASLIEGNERWSPSLLQLPAPRGLMDGRLEALYIERLKSA